MVRPRRARRSRRTFCWFGISLLLLASCSPPAEAPRVPLSWTVTAGAGAALPLAAVVTDDDSSHELACDKAGGECRTDGLATTVRAGEVSVTVKKRGYAWQTTGTHVPDDEAGGSGTTLLTPLPAATQNEDYATGFAAGAAGRDAFLELADPNDTELGPTQVVKFFVHNAQTDAPEMYFQNTHKHFLHYEFAHKVLKLPGGSIDFGKQTYYGEERTNLAGTLVWYRELEVPVDETGRRFGGPLVLTFFPSDDLSPRLVRLAHRLLEERLGFLAAAGDQDRLVYQPAGSVQDGELAGAVDALAAAGVPWMRREHLYANLTVQLLNDGVAYGTLRRMTPDELAEAVVSYNDILVLVRLPNELPIVGGTITEELQTPLAHVNVAARTRGTPNMTLLGAGDDPRVAPLLGKLVRFEVSDGTFTLQEATLEEAQSFWESQARDPTVPASNLAPVGLLPFDEVDFADALLVGVKAANLAELSRLLGDNAPHGFAVPFYEYQRFLDESLRTNQHCLDAGDDCLEDGRTPKFCLAALELCEDGPDPEPVADYLARLLGDARFQADTLVREAALDGVRHILCHMPVNPAFAKELDACVTEEFGLSRVRLRSSTNAEDLESFSGAGLYTSVGADAAGPEAASLRIRRVWASVWNFKAVEERRFWNMDDLAVKMGVAVHQAFPDEQANGVLITQNISDFNVAGMYVNVQLGEVPVTNPVNGAIPEIFAIVPKPNSGIQISRERYSSLSPGKAILADDEVGTLFEAAWAVQKHFAKLYGKDPFGLALDLEFKFRGPKRQLIIKQARPYEGGF